jgi:hypothetical protein
LAWGKKPGLEPVRTPDPRTGAPYRRAYIGYWPANWRLALLVIGLPIDWPIGNRLDQSIRPTPAVYTAPVLRAAPGGPGPVPVAEEEGGGEGAPPRSR